MHLMRNMNDSNLKTAIMQILGNVNNAQWNYIR